MPVNLCRQTFSQSNSTQTPSPLRKHSKVSGNTHFISLTNLFDLFQHSVYIYSQAKLYFSKSFMKKPVQINRPVIYNELTKSIQG